MEQQNQTQSSLFSLNLDAQNSYTLRSAASWARVLGIVGIIIGILFFITGILVQQAIKKNYGLYDSYSYRRSGMSAESLGAAGMAVYILLAIVFIVSSIFALNAGNKITRGLQTNDQPTLNAGFAGVRNYFAFWAILMIIFVMLMLIGVMGNL